MTLQRDESRVFDRGVYFPRRQVTRDMGRHCRNAFSIVGASFMLVAFVVIMALVLSCQPQERRVGRSVPSPILLLHGGA